MQIVPIQSVPSQILQVILDGQACTISIYQKTSGLYIDLLVDNVLIIGGVICQNLNRIVRSLYLGFLGDFIFIDTQGSNDPDYTGLGTRYQLGYLETDDLPANVG